MFYHTFLVMVMVGAIHRLLNLRPRPRTKRLFIACPISFP